MEKTIRRTVEEHNFIKLYLDDLNGVLNISGDVELEVMCWFYRNMKWGNEAIIVDKQMKEVIAKEIGKKTQSISDAITRLYHKNLLLRPSRLRYFPNPRYFFKGDEVTRGKVLKVSVNYEIK
jgi:hypothetical protein